MTAAPAKKTATYDPSVFLNVGSVDDAVRIILTPEEGMTSVHRWREEAPILMDLMDKHIPKGGSVLDYGCGIGRLSKPLIDKNGCEVIGVDISPNMRALAASCVQSDKFFALHPDMLHYFDVGFCDAAIAIWTLQHCQNPQTDIGNIRRAITRGGPLFVLNNVNRAVPTSDGQWVHDGVDIDSMIRRNKFSLIERGQLENTSIAPGWMKEGTFWAAYRRE